MAPAAVSSLLDAIDATTIATVAHWSASARAAAVGGAALATAAARAGGSRAALLRASAAAGAAIASTAVSYAAMDASILGVLDAFPSPRAILPTPPSSADDALLALLRGRSVREIGDVVDLMRRIEALLPDGDGLKAFNLLYRLVTEAVMAATSWENGPWILGLDVRFADLYFSGIEACLDARAGAPAAWRVLVDRRRQPGISPVQFALAGMSAHINRDLAVAVVRTWRDLGPEGHGPDTAEFRDYQRINDVLDAVEPEAMRVLARGLMGILDQAASPVDGWAAMAAIRAARDLAFGHAGNLATAGFESDDGRAYVAALDAVAADAGRAALATLC